MEIKTVLAAVDFSEASRLALDCAVAAARQFRADLILLHVVEASDALAYAFPASSKNGQERLHKQALRMMCALVAPEDQGDLNVRILVRHGNIAHEIQAAVREQSVDLVALGSHGHRQLGELLMGSVTKGLIRQLPVPVLTVSRSHGAATFSRILVATDFSQAASRAVEFAAELTKSVEGQLIIMHSAQVRIEGYGATVPIADIEAEKAADLADARRRLEEIAKEIATRSINVETILREGAAAQNILQAATDSAANLIVLGIANKGWLEKIVLGTTAERLIRDARVPVLCVPTRDESETMTAEQDRETNHPVFLIG